MKELCRDLAEEYEALDAMVAGFGHDGWMRETPFYGWTVKDQISHLAYFDRAAGISIKGDEPFKAHFEELLSHGSTYDEIHTYANSVGCSMDDGELLEWWRTERNNLIRAYLTVEPSRKLPWYGPPMSARSSATARLMETWAHGQDVADALSIRRPATPRLKHIVHLGWSTFKWTFVNRGLAVPEDKPYLTLEGPGGEIWTYGEDKSGNTVKGTALDFCLVVTQRRNVADTGLEVKGDAAANWMAMAQVFAGPPEEPPGPGTRR
jgi:uncharacterized protein (TIGR03084 family)